MDQNNDIKPVVNEPKTETGETHPVNKTIVATLIIGLIAGLAGGVYGSLDLARRPSIQKLFGFSGSGATATQNLVVNEQSDTTKVVEQVSPAVVSIIISKDLSAVPRFGFFAPQPSGLQQVGAGSGFFVS